jgi:hypothetical protein
MAGTGHWLQSRSASTKPWPRGMTRNELPKRSAAEPRQRVVAGERLPSGLTASLNARSKCQGTIEDHRNIAFDVRELTRRPGNLPKALISYGSPRLEAAARVKPCSPKGTRGSARA